MEQLKIILSLLDNPAIRFSSIGVFSAASAGLFILINKPGRFKYDTVTDLKKKAKSFNKLNYQDKNKSKSAF
jgi:hypothetical protein